jgi:hypothetical protein
MDEIDAVWLVGDDWYEKGVFLTKSSKTVILI